LGELYDENEVAEMKIERLKDGTWQLQGDTPLYWLEDKIGHPIEKDGYINTIGGHIVERLDRLPLAGEVVNLTGEGQFEIVAVENNHITLLHFYPLKEDNNTKENNGTS
jgi:CBS domain containing-hemolysin-like protein